MDREIKCHKPVKYSSITQSRLQLITTKNSEVQTLLLKLQLFFVLFIQFSKPMGSVIIYSFVNQFVQNTGITREDEREKQVIILVSSYVFHLCSAVCKPSSFSIHSSCHVLPQQCYFC